VDADQSETVEAARKGRRTRRSWSRAEKGRIVAEAFRPDASTADVARGYGLNANQVFNWRRALAASARSRRRPASPAAAAKALAVPSAGILPIGMIVPTSDGELALAPMSIAGSGQLNQRATPPGERTGLIEIDLICGTCLRVDAFVDERALQRVLSALKASS